MGIDKLDDDAVRNLFYDNSETYFKYKRAKKQRTLGTVLTTTGILALCGAATCIIIDDPFSYNDDEGMAAFCSFLAGGVVLTPIGILTNKSASSKVRDIANEYNKKNSYAECRLDLVAPSTGGIGLRLTF